MSEQEKTSAMLPAEQPEQQEGPDARAQLHALAMELTRGQNRRTLLEYLRLRRRVQIGK